MALNSLRGYKGVQEKVLLAHCVSESERAHKGLQAHTVSDTLECSTPHEVDPSALWRLDASRDTSVNLELYSLRLEKINQMKKQLREQGDRVEDRFESNYAKELAPKLKDA